MPPSWNQHNDRTVGATLLDNWVEERAVGPLAVTERDIRHISKRGHTVRRADVSATGGADQCDA